MISKYFYTLQYIFFSFFYRKYSYNIDHYQCLFHEHCNVLRKFENLSKFVIYLIAQFFVINRKSFAENHSLVHSKKLYPIFFIFLFNFQGCCYNINIFKKSIFWANILRQIAINILPKIHQINHYLKMS